MCVCLLSYSTETNVKRKAFSFNNKTPSLFMKNYQSPDENQLISRYNRVQDIMERNVNRILVIIGLYFYPSHLRETIFHVYHRSIKIPASRELNLKLFNDILSS